MSDVYLTSVADWSNASNAISDIREFMSFLMDEQRLLDINLLEWRNWRQSHLHPSFAIGHSPFFSDDDDDEG